MGLYNSIKSLWNRTQNTVTLTESSEQTVYRVLGDSYQFGTQSRDFLLDAYGQNPYVYMVVDRIASRLVQLDKKVFDLRGEEIEDVEFEELLKEPNSKESGDELIYRAVATYLSTGECFLVRRTSEDERTEFFVPINYNVTINQDTKGNVIDYHITQFGDSDRYFKTEVLHLFKPDITFDTNHGFSTLQAIRKVWESNNEVWSSEASLHRNKGITGIVYSDGNMPMTDKEQKDLQSKYDRDNTGSHNFGKVKVSNSKLGYIPMGMNPNDLKSIETRIEHLRTVCAAFNTDSKLFGDPAASTYNNMAEASRAFILNAVLPIADLILPQMARFMSFSLLKSYSMKVDKDDIMELQITLDQRSERLQKEVQTGILTAEQAREILYPELTQEQ